MMDDLKTTKFNDEVFFAIDTIVKIDKKAIIGLKQMAKLNKRRRFRLCAHNDIEDSLSVYTFSFKSKIGCHV